MAPSGDADNGDVGTRNVNGTGDDDYDLDDLTVADGYRPRQVELTAGSHQAPLSQPYSPSTRRKTPPPRPSSITKPSRSDSFTLQHDGALGHLAASSRTSPRDSHDTSLFRPASASSITTEYVEHPPFDAPRSTASSTHELRSAGADRLARTASVITTSTAPMPSERSYTGPNGPAHPYLMYPQNTAPSAESTAGDGAEDALVGFPGHANHYQRRLGTEGEEAADLIGADGHTEQLPPYSLYSDDAVARKQRAHLVAPISGAGGIGLATRNPEFESSGDDLRSPESQSSETQSVEFASEIALGQRALETEISEEKPKPPFWQVVARRRICGIVPVWAIILAGIILIIFVLILGIVLAVLKQKHSNKPQDSVSQSDNQPSSATSSVVTTATPDASPYSTLPAGVSSLPTGTYALPMSAPTLSQSSCIEASAQNAAWSCQLAPASFNIIIDQIPGADPLAGNVLTIKNSNRSLDSFQYGAQKPVLRDPQVLSLVSDVQEPNRGPAWFFQTVYDKVVHLPERAVSQSSTRRDLDMAMYQVSRRSSEAIPGEKPWVCTWNSTLLEIFVYANQASVSAHNSTILASLSSETSTSTTTSSAPQTSESRWVPAVYPDVVKMIERRMPQTGQSIAPQCVQYVILDDWSIQPFINPSTGLNVILTIDENQPSNTGPIASKRSTVDQETSDPDGSLVPRQTSASCGCIWVVN